MTTYLPVDFHCHTIFSDGGLTPEVLAESLSRAGVQFASLTDHDTIAGLQRFKAALHRLNIGFINGVEITTVYKGQEVHILGYGFNELDIDLNAMLDSIRQVKNVEIQGVTNTIRKAANSSTRKFDGKVELARAIKVLHHAGGIAFLAHPLQYLADLTLLESKLNEFRTLGLDGIEVWYSPYTSSQQEALAHLAQKMGFLVSAGSDFHEINGSFQGTAPINFPKQHWVKFRNSLRSWQAQTEQPKNPPVVPEGIPDPSKSSLHFPRRRLVMRIILPVLFTITLFIAALWGLILPSFEQSLLDRKREMISELTNSAWSILATYERSEREGQLTREEAQQLAITQISALRYGSDGKGYFWLQDLSPRILMHPYRQDLIGMDVSNFQDPNGVRIFVKFADLVKRQDEGYVQYVWQWNDDPDRLEAKESFVKGFSPWGWIIGTGLYVEDVQQEIARIETRVVNISLVITSILVLLLLFIAYQGVLVESRRQEAERGQREATEKFRSLVEATTEGVLMVLGRRCRYANPMLLKTLNLTSDQLELVDIEDLLPKCEENTSAWNAIDQQSLENTFEGVIADNRGQLITCAMTVNPIQSEGHDGYVITVKPLGNALHPVQGGALIWKLGETASRVNIGLFKAKPNKQATISEINPYGVDLLTRLLPPEISQPGLENLFSDHEGFNKFLEKLHNDGGSAETEVAFATNQNQGLTIRIQAKLELDEQGKPSGISGILLDATEAVDEKQNLTDRVEELESRLAFLNKPLAEFENHLVSCIVDTHIGELLKIMETENISAVLVMTPEGKTIGMITDRELRKILFSPGFTEESPVGELVPVPVLSIKETALTYQAIRLMEEKGVNHLAVENALGQVVNIISLDQLLRFQDYGAQMMGDEIGEAGSMKELAVTTARIPLVIKGLIESSVKPARVSRILSSFNDAVVHRLFELAYSEFGEPPCEFAFVSAGSHGRQEPSLASDQDNAFIYQSPTSEEKNIEVEQYFLKLGEYVCNGLSETGSSFCPGQIMANNPRWIMPLQAWIRQFHHWINKAEPNELLDFSIFFDLRCVQGSRQITNRLLDEISAEVRTQPIFFAHLAQNLLSLKEPILPTGIAHFLNPDNTSHDPINLKDFLLPLSGSIRLYALSNSVRKTNTLDRVEALTRQKVFHSRSSSELTNTIEFLYGLRWRNQLSMIQKGQTPNNLISPDLLDGAEKALLKASMEQIHMLQQKVRTDFLGGTQA